MLTIGIVGRPNVGKSTLFNRITKTRGALVLDEPGVTRDRVYGIARGKEGQSALVIDTGGLRFYEEDSITKGIKDQALHALEEADVIFFVTDALMALCSEDEKVASLLRQSNKPLYVLVNKTETMEASIALSDFYALGLKATYLAISAKQNQGIKALMQSVWDAHATSDIEEVESGIKLAMLGRPNVGKSTLINRLLKEERVLTMDAPGTTRDSVHIPFSQDGVDFTLIDTAGIRRRKQTEEGVEKISVLKTLESIERADVVVLMLDAHKGVVEQDLRLLRLALDYGSGLIIVINKIDGMSDYDRSQLTQAIERKMGFTLDAIPVHFISAKHGNGIGKILPMVERVYTSSTKTVSTKMLNDLLKRIVYKHNPPIVGGIRPKLRYAHQGGRNPLRVIVHGNRISKLPLSYKRYLQKAFTEALELKGSVVHLRYLESENPYSD